MEWNGAKHSDMYVLSPNFELYGMECCETTLPDGSVVYLGGTIKHINGRIDISVFDKAADWPFLVLRYPTLIPTSHTINPQEYFKASLCVTEMHVIQQKKKNQMCYNTNGT